ncbi:MAG: hypothetical protein D6690_17990, partial [Nitrospirae bacterium]
ARHWPPPLPPPLSDSAFPHPFIVQIDSRDPAIAAALETLAWQAGWCVAASNGDQAILREELRRQLIDASESRLSAGHWQAPTAILRAQHVSDDDGQRLVLILTPIGSQRVLASVQVQAKDEVVYGVLGEAWAVLSERIRQAPGCDR